MHGVRAVCGLANWVWRQSTFTIKAFASPQGKAQVLFIIEHCVILVIFKSLLGCNTP